MAWITPVDVEPIIRQDLSGDSYIDGLITHAQGLAEVEVGEQAEPVSSGLAAILTQVVARMWQDSKSAEVNPAGLAMEVSGPFTIQDTTPGVAGLGLTNREIKALRKAAGLRNIGVLSTTRGNVETRWVDPTFDDGEGLAL